VASAETERERSHEQTLLKQALKSQFHAALAMLRQAIEACPDDAWASGSDRNPFWRIAYHTLYYVHLYLLPEAPAFKPWEHHQTGIQDLDDRPAPPEIQDLTEHPHRPPQTGEPYSKAQVLEYWEACDAGLDAALDRLDLSSTDSGFSWYAVSKLEHVLVTLRHTQHHTGQLTDRVRRASDRGVGWVGAQNRASPFAG